MILSVQCKTLFKKEVLRFLRVYGQTLMTPILSSLLYLFIFGLSLGKQISMLEDFSYLEFIIPGLIIMGIINNSYQNTASSILIAKFHGNIHDILVAPISYLDIVTAYTLGAMVRGIGVGLITFLVSLLFASLPMHNLPVILITALLTSIIFAQVGIIAAIFSPSFDKMSMITNYVLMPLTYLSGVFYSIQILPPFWQTVSMYNPLLYLVDAFRYGFLGISDIPILKCLIVAFLFVILLVSASTFVLKRGYVLRK
jgi:ABC-2 type transport system permease protein